MHITKHFYRMQRLVPCDYINDWGGCNSPLRSSGNSYGKIVVTICFIRWYFYMLLRLLVSTKIWDSIQTLNVSNFSGVITDYFICDIACRQLFVNVIGRTYYSEKVIFLFVRTRLCISGARTKCLVGRQTLNLNSRIPIEEYT